MCVIATNEDRLREQRKKAKQRYFAKKLETAKEILCACGCGNKLLEYDNYARKRKFISGHNGRKYKDSKQHKREWNHRNRKSRYDYKRQYLKKRKGMLVVEKGGKCLSCDLEYDGTNACVFDFHHRNPEEKEYNIRLNVQGLKRIREELEKCDLLCANCHRMEHYSGH